MCFEYRSKCVQGIFELMAEGKLSIRFCKWGYINASCASPRAVSSKSLCALLGTGLEKGRTFETPIPFKALAPWQS